MYVVLRTYLQGKRYLHQYELLGSVTCEYYVKVSPTLLRTHVTDLGLCNL